MHRSGSTSLNPYISSVWLPLSRCTETDLNPSPGDITGTIVDTQIAIQYFSLQVEQAYFYQWEGGSFFVQLLFELSFTYVYHYHHFILLFGYEMVTLCTKYIFDRRFYLFLLFISIMLHHRNWQTSAVVTYFLLIYELMSAAEWWAIKPCNL